MSAFTTVLAALPIAENNIVIAPSRGELGTLPADIAPLALLALAIGIVILRRALR